MSTHAAKLFAKKVQGSEDMSEKIDALAKAIIALANAIDKVEYKLKRRTT
jgi:hypothetical protein